MPTLRYIDAPAAIDWLERAFGFVAHLVVPAEPEAADSQIPDSQSIKAGPSVAVQPKQIAHAQLRCGEVMIMLGSIRDDAFGKLLKTPAAAGGATSCPYIIVADLKPHYERAQAAGAEIVQEYEEQPYGGALYTARDPEGHIWCFGSYDPYADGCADE